MNFRLLLAPSTCLAAALLLSACGSGPKPSAQAIGDVKVEQALVPAWSVKLAGDTALNQSLPMQDGQLAMVSKNGHVHVVRADTGRLVWQLALKTDLNTGAGFDGRNVAVVTRSNELVAVADGKVSWRTRLTAQSYTNPLVAGERVFVLLADRSVAAFDLATGQRLWVQQRSGEALVLKQNGVLMAFQNNLLAGLGGKLVALNPDNGQVRWEVPIANPRGINDLERLVDLVASPSRLSNSVCVRAFQAQVGCVDALRGALLWTRPANGVQGVGGDGTALAGAESNGVVQAWNRSTGERLWDTDRLKYRELTAPLWTSKGVVVGDAGGYLYVLSGQDGRLMNKLKTPASGFASSPTALPDGGFVVLTRNGLLQAYQLP
jgi:outer membrane protein assembly factor BamB